MSYAIKEIFPTIQGEGLLAGKPAIFLRFAGCNLWSGQEEHRERDAERNKARCPKFCDTNFVSTRPGSTLEEVVTEIDLALFTHGWGYPPLIVFTGGEPALQLDARLLRAVKAKWPKTKLAIETNGTVQFKQDVNFLLDHICVSPKTGDEDIVIRHGHELKVVFPGYKPNQYLRLERNFEHKFVSPEAAIIGGEVGKSLIVGLAMKEAADFVLKNPSWRLSLQTHKVIGIP